MVYARISIHESDIQGIVNTWKHNTNLCNSTSCPIKHTHCMGRYLHNGEYSRAGHHGLFGSNNPPPDIWAAADRVQHQSVEGSSTDLKKTLSFYANHVLIIVDDAGEQESI